jgi:hypothetical protein
MYFDMGRLISTCHPIIKTMAHNELQKYIAWQQRTPDGLAPLGGTWYC